MSPILVTLMSHSDSNFECLNISLKENKRDGADLNSDGLDHCIRKNEGKILWFSADCNAATMKPDLPTWLNPKPGGSGPKSVLSPF